MLSKMKKMQEIEICVGSIVVVRGKRSTERRREKYFDLFFKKKQNFTKKIQFSPKMIQLKKFKTLGPQS